MSETLSRPRARFEAVQEGPDGAIRLGVVRIVGDGYLSIEAMAPGQQERLAAIVQTMNDAESLHVRLPPPPGSSRYLIVSRRVPRGDPAFMETLREQLQRFYGVSLAPV